MLVSEEAEQVRFPARVERVCKLLDVAETAQALNRLVEAIEAYAEAEKLMRALMEDDPENPAHVQSLGAALYVAGEARFAFGDALGAVDTLRRAEQAYRALRRFESAPATLARRIADVRLRRARGLAMLGRAASALVDAQAAVIEHLRGWSGSSRDEPALDVARVLAWNARITETVGDPDLAVASADIAIRIYCARAPEINARPGLLALHGPTFLLATVQAAKIHRAFGRPDLADMAAKLASQTVHVDSERDAASLLAENVASTTTLSAALTVANALELRTSLVAPAVEAILRVPLERLRGRRAAALVGELARVGAQIMADHPDAGLRIALEAHTIRAGAAEFDMLGEPTVLELGTWITLLRRAAETSERLGRRALARDFGDSLIGACAEFVRLAQDAPTELHASTESALIWIEHLLSSIGEADAARLCHDVLASLRATDVVRLRKIVAPVEFPRGPGAPVRIDLGDQLATLDELLARVAHDPDPTVLKLADQLAEHAVTHVTIPEGRVHALAVLCALRRIHADRGGGIAVLRDAVRIGRKAYELAMHTQSQHERCAATLSMALVDLYQQEHDIAVIDEAVALSRLATDGLDPDDPRYVGQLGNLANALFLAARAHNKLDLLDEAITLGRSARTALAPEDDRPVNIWLGLASALWQRTIMTCSTGSLVEAHMYAQKALQQMEPWHPKRSAVVDLVADLEHAMAILRR